MKKIFYLRKSNQALALVLDPYLYLGKEFIFDEYYLIKILTVKKNNFTISLEMDGESFIDRIPISDFFNYLAKGTMVEKTDVLDCKFESFEEYYDLASSFLLINYNTMIVSLEFDWEFEFIRKTPIEVACKMALGMIKR